MQHVVLSTKSKCSWSWKAVIQMMLEMNCFFSPFFSVPELYYGNQVLFFVLQIHVARGFAGISAGTQELREERFVTW